MNKDDDDEIELQLLYKELNYFYQSWNNIRHDIENGAPCEISSEKARYTNMAYYRMRFNTTLNPDPCTIISDKDYTILSFDEVAKIDWGPYKRKVLLMYVDINFVTNIKSGFGKYAFERMQIDCNSYEQLVALIDK